MRPTYVHGKLHVTVGYIPLQSQDDSILSASSDTPTRYMDYLFERQSGSWYLTGLTESETKPASTSQASSSSAPTPMAGSEMQEAILASVESSSPVGSESAASSDAEQAPEADSPASSEADSSAG